MKQPLLPDVLALAADGMSASLIQERLGIPRSVRTIQRWITDELGSIPTKREVYARNPMREAVVAYMVAAGLPDHYCSVCQMHSFHPCLIRFVDKVHRLDHAVFVCRKDSRPGDC